METETEVVFDEVAESVKPDFIYGGPFIPAIPVDGFLNTATPVNSYLQGLYKKSYAYTCLKERLPIILTKIIDSLAKKAGEDEKKLIKYIAELKNELVTNKQYKKFTIDTKDAKNWNEWIDGADSRYYFTNLWVFSECYVYRRIREGCELIPSLVSFDPFFEQKQKAFIDALDYMCLVADTLTDMLNESDKDKMRTDFMNLLKLSLWANKCDLSFSKGEDMTSCLGGSGEHFVHPITMIADNKDKLLVDDSGKIYDTLKAKSESVRKNLDDHTSIKYKCSCERLNAGLPPSKGPPSKPATEGEGEADDDAAEVAKCPTKFTSPSVVMFDIVCDNSGYELFTDLCIAHYVIEQNIADRVRFHVKKIPWFVSDVTAEDMDYVIQQATVMSKKTSYPGPPPTAEGEESKEIIIDSDNLQVLGAAWKKHMDEKKFMVLNDEFWTSPHVYKDMKKYNPNLYRKLQFAIGVIFKGDLNYRKLLGDKNWNTNTGFDAALQGFNPAPVMALRTVKAELICGLPKGKAEGIALKDENWMIKGEYGVIQMSAKAEALKPSTVPCEDYDTKCYDDYCPPRDEY